MPPASASFDGADSFIIDPSMPSFNFGNEFELFDSEDTTQSVNALYGGLDDDITEHTGFGDPKALLHREPMQMNPLAQYTSLHRESGSSSSSQVSAGADSALQISPHTTRTSMDVNMLEAPWKMDDMMVHHEHSMALDNVDMSNALFDFDSASSSPEPAMGSHTAQTSVSPEMTTSASAPRVKRVKGHHKAPSQISLTKGMSGLKANGSREVSPASNFVLSHASSPSATFNSTPSPENHINMFGNIGSIGVSSMWKTISGLSTQHGLPQVVRAAPESSSVPQAHFVAQTSTSSVPRPRLFVQPTPLKSRVETQIPIKLTIHHLPAGIKRIHLPSHTISKPKLLAKPTAVRSPDMLELSTMLVCTSAMQDPAKRERAFARAATNQFDQHSAREFEEDDENKGQNGGEVRICAGCITRERKRAGRKKHKKPEEEDLWNRFETERVIVFNTQEVKEWQAVTPHMADPTGAGLRDSVPEGTVQVDAPMRIACYCRHHGEKMGFQVIFTVKDYKDNLVAQQISSSIMITDDHKTHLPASVLSHTASLAGNDAKPIEASAPFRNQPEQPPVAIKQTPVPVPTYPHTTTASTATNSRSNSVVATPQNASRQASPSSMPLFPPPTASKKRKASVSTKVPSGLAMTKLEPTQQPQMPAAPQSNDANVAPAHTSPFSPTLGNFAANTDSFFTTQAGINMNQPFATGPPTPNSNGADQLVYPSNRTLSLDNLPPQLFSAPVTAHPSRASSPATLRREIHMQMGQNYNAPVANNQPLVATGPRPMIYKIIPGEGPKSGGVEVTILGSGFTNGGLEVMFGDNRAATTTFWGETSLVCLLPPSAITGLVPVSIKQPMAPAPVAMNGNSQPLFRYVDDDEHRLIRTALTVLGNKLGGKMTDVAEIARNIIYGPVGTSSGGSWNSTSPNSSAPGGSNYNSMEKDADIEGGLLKVLELIDLDDSANKARINLRRSSGQTMLHLACSLGFGRFVAGLLSRGASIGIRDKGGYTALHMAAMNDHPEIVRRLILKGADPSMRTLSGLTAADVACSQDVLRVLRRIETHSRSRSASSLRSRANSASSLRSLWDPPSSANVASTEYLDGDDSMSSDSDSSAEIDSDEEERDWVEMTRRSRSSTIQAPELATASSRLNIDMSSPTAAMSAFRDHITAQIQQFQQSMATHLPQMPQMPQMPTSLPDYHSYLPQRPAIPRMSSLVPKQLFTAKEAPPAYEDIFPQSQRDLDTKQASAAQAAVDYEADTKCATLFDQPETSTATMIRAEVKEAETELASLFHVGRKGTISLDQQEQLKRVHAASLKTGSHDKMLWLFWLPILFLILGMMMANIAPSVFTGTYQAIKTIAVAVAEPRQIVKRIGERLVEVA